MSDLRMVPPPQASFVPGRLLEVTDLRTYLDTSDGLVRAVDGVSFHVNRAEVLGIVGESGCGKTITALSVAGLPPTSATIVGGKIIFEGQNLLEKSASEMREIRGRRIGAILQDPKSSLNPTFTVGTQIAAPIRSHGALVSGRLNDRVVELLSLIRIASPELRALDYPHQMSGGMRQRVVGAIALSCSPSLLIADEPTTALDVTTQAEYLDLLEDLQSLLGLAIIVITHDFGVVARLCDRVAVMYAGRIVETADVEDLFDRPFHPYTKALLRLLPGELSSQGRLESISGHPPDLRQTIEGCRFAARCNQAMDVCRQQYPSETSAGKDHTVSCWLNPGTAEAR